jgi:hypothetical protein
VLAAAAVLRDRGYDELPVLAWALLDVARSRGQTELVDARSSSRRAPRRALRSRTADRESLEFLAAVRGLARATSRPPLALGAGRLRAARRALVLASASAPAAFRGVPLHGHALGHA